MERDRTPAGPLPTPTPAYLAREEHPYRPFDQDSCSYAHAAQGPVRRRSSVPAVDRNSDGYHRRGLRDQDRDRDRDRDRAPEFDSARGRVLDDPRPAWRHWDAPPHRVEQQHSRDDQDRGKDWRWDPLHARARRPSCHSYSHERGSVSPPRRGSAQRAPAPAPAPAPLAVRPYAGAGRSLKRLLGQFSFFRVKSVQQLKSTRPGEASYFTGYVHCVQASTEADAPVPPELFFNSRGEHADLGLRVGPATLVGAKRPPRLGDLLVGTFILEPDVGGTHAARRCGARLATWTSNAEPLYALLHMVFAGIDMQEDALRCALQQPQSLLAQDLLSHALKPLESWERSELARQASHRDDLWVLARVVLLRDLSPLLALLKAEAEAARVDGQGQGGQGQGGQGQGGQDASAARPSDAVCIGRSSVQFVELLASELDGIEVLKDFKALAPPEHLPQARVPQQPAQAATPFGQSQPAFQLGVPYVHGTVQRSEASTAAFSYAPAYAPAYVQAHAGLAAPLPLDTRVEYDPSATYSPASPVCRPRTPAYTPASPAYGPPSATSPPAYGPSSPAYAPSSPAFGPTSAAYAPASPVWGACSADPAPQQPVLHPAPTPRPSATLFAKSLLERALQRTPRVVQEPIQDS